MTTDQAAIENVRSSVNLIQRDARRQIGLKSLQPVGIDKLEEDDQRILKGE